MHPKHIYRSSANVGAAKALDRVLARIVRDELDAQTDPAPGDDAAAAERGQVDPGKANELTP